MDVKIIQGQGILAGGTVTYTCTLSVGISAYVDKGIYLLQVNATNTTTAPTIDLNALGAKTVFARNGAALPVGAMFLNEWDIFVYIAADNGFRLITPVDSVGSDWTLSGNALTGSEHTPNEFFGSTNNFDVLFKENNVEIMRIRDGKVGIGTINPTDLLHVFTTVNVGGINIDASVSPFLLFNINGSPGFYIRPGYNGAFLEIFGSALTSSLVQLSPAGNMRIGSSIATPLATRRLAVEISSVAITDFIFVCVNGNTVDVFSVTADGGINFLKGIDTTSGDTATINATAGRFRKDATGSTFTLTNSFITANSIIMLTYASDPGITGFTMIAAAGAGSMVVTFFTSGVAAAPTNVTDVNFLVIN